MPERKYFTDTATINDVKEETEDKLVVRAAIAQEMVQDYGPYKALKPWDALESAMASLRTGAYLTDGHPSEGVVVNQSDIIGAVRNPEANEDEKKLYADLTFFKEKTKPEVIEEIKDEERTDVSIGFYADEMLDDGRHEGEYYDRKQTNIVIDHVASLAPDMMGRCSSEEGCGITENMDQAVVADLKDSKDEIEIANIATDSESSLIDAVKAIRGEGLSANVRECNCGDHHGHIEVEDVDLDDLEADESDRDHFEIVDRNKEDPKFDWVRIYDEHGFSGMPSDENVDNFIREDGQPSNKDDIMSKDDLDITEDELEELRAKADKADELEEKADEADELKESMAEDLREELKNDYGFDEERVEDADLDSLRTMRDTARDLQDDEEDEGEDGDGNNDGSVVGTGTGNGGSTDANEIENHKHTNDDGFIEAEVDSQSA